MNTLTKYEDESFELIKVKNTVIVKDKARKKFYEVREEECRDIPWINVKKKLSDRFYCIWIIVLILLCCCNIYLTIFFKQVSSVDLKVFWIMFSGYCVISIFLHECSHIIAFRFMGRRIDKVGFKFNYIFPSFYVKMNDIYMLDKKEKIFVHSAGIFINLLLNCVLFLLAYIFQWRYMLLITVLFGLEIIWNLLPIMDSDGYKILLTILNLNKKHMIKRNSIIINLFIIFNIVFSIAYLYNFIRSITLNYQ